jgi:hypothetical protein
LDATVFKRPWYWGVEFAQPVDVDVQDGDVGAEAQGHGGSIGARDACAQDHDLGGADARNAAEQHALAAGGRHQGRRTHLDGQPAGHLGHGREQGQGAAFLDGLVGDGGDAGVDELLGQLGLGGEVQVGEEDQALAEAVVLGLDGFLDLHHHVGAGPDLVGVGDDFCASDGVFLVGDAGTQARAALHQDRVAVGAEFVNAAAVMATRNSLFLISFGDTDDHFGLQIRWLQGRNVLGKL